MAEAEFEQRATILKTDDDQRIVWGWAYVVEKNGEGVVDHSGQMALAKDVQAAAHAFIKTDRAGGVDHVEKAGEIVDSIFFSESLQKALDIDLGRVGWFIGFAVESDDVWKDVKAGKLKMFSIAGKADVVDLEAA